MSPRLKTALKLAAIAAVVVFAFQGGEYGTADLFSQRARRARLQRQIDSLQRDVDSLTRLRRAVLTDPAVQERIAREAFGMVRGNEILYRFADPDSARRR
ncbi:MAG TPA: septum formation initiator family protein [Gemmatimonadaceae bacterium]|nr:septum formation initiator family protein [Gemmatimonadaceae bacterium]